MSRFFLLYLALAAAAPAAHAVDFSGSVTATSDHVQFGGRFALAEDLFGDIGRPRGELAASWSF